MGHRRRGDGDLHRLVREAFDEFEVLDLDPALGQRELVGHHGDERRLLQVLLARLALGAFGLHALELDAVQLVDEVDMEARAAVFAVGDGVEANRFLELHRPLDRLVLVLAQLVRRDLARVPFVAHRQQFRRTQEAADMIGTEGRLTVAHTGGPPDFVVLAIDCTRPYDRPRDQLRPTSRKITARAISRPGDIPPQGAAGRDLGKIFVALGGLANSDRADFIGGKRNRGTIL